VFQEMVKEESSLPWEAKAFDRLELPTSRGDLGQVFIDRSFIGPMLLLHGVTHTRRLQRSFDGAAAGMDNSYSIASF